MNAKVIDIQHSIFSDEHLWYKIRLTKSKHSLNKLFCPTNFIVWDQQTKNFLLRNGIKKSNIHIAGYVSSQFLSKKANYQISKSKIILFTLQWGRQLKNHETLPFPTYISESIIKAQNVLIIFRQHPRTFKKEKEDQTKSLINPPHHRQINPDVKKLWIYYLLKSHQPSIKRQFP